VSPRGANGWHDFNSAIDEAVLRSSPVPATQRVGLRLAASSATASAKYSEEDREPGRWQSAEEPASLLPVTTARLK
jgi:hypothetical protein